ncbi:ABC transporter permease, partial [Bacteroidota bacterium]
MWKNYFTIAIRNLKKDKLNSLVNIFGLSIGLASSILILFFVRNELSYDTFHQKADRIYRICTEHPEDEGEEGIIRPFTSALLGQTLQLDLPEIERYIRMTDYVGIVRLDDKM